MENQCRILAWSDWGGFADMLKQLYWDAYKREIQLVFSDCKGGGDLLNRMATIDNFDIVIGDRELLWALGNLGKLLPIGLTAGSEADILRTYPKWLRRFCVSERGRLTGVPLRWGTTSLMVNRKLLGKGKTIASALSNAGSSLFWTPNNYYFYSMSVLAAALNPTFPFNLAPPQFDKLKKTFEDLLKKPMFHAPLIEHYISAMMENKPDVIICFGEWVGTNRILDRLKKTHDYRFPGNNSTIAFFETLGLVNNYRNQKTKWRVAKLLSSVPFRRKLCQDAVGTEHFYTNSTVDDRDVIVPECYSGKASKLMSACIERSLPTDHMYSPKMEDWNALWEQSRENAIIITNPESSRQEP